MRKDHWQNIYQNKTDNEVSWTQTYPSSVMEYMGRIGLPKEAPIIDVGGGTGRLVDVLIGEGFRDITVLDISEAALTRSQKRLGELAKKVKWVLSDINDFSPAEKYAFWYDRAVFHFLTDQEEVMAYVDKAQKAIVPEGHFFLGTFSDNGPLKCSGLEVRRYSESDMKETFKPHFEAQYCFKEEHKTPFDTVQEFQFCGFKKSKERKVSSTDL